MDQSDTDDDRRMDLSPGWLFASFFVSTVGFSFFLYGKMQRRVPQLAAGVTLMVYPCFVASPVWIITVAAGLFAGLWLVTRAGL